MKRPSLKRSKKQPTPQELGAASPPPAGPAPEPVAPAPESVAPESVAQESVAPGSVAPEPIAVPDPSAEVFAPIPKKPSRVRGGLGKVGGGVGNVGGRVGRVAAAPVRKLGGLKGRARIIAWALVAVIVVIVALQLRGGRDDEQLVREALARFEKASADKDYQTLCDQLFASSYVRQTASSGLPCEVALRTGLEDVKNPTLEVLSVEVNGDRAAARVRGTAAGQVPGESVYTLVREGDQWKILPPRPDSPAP